MNGSASDKSPDTASYDRQAPAYDKHIRRLAGPLAQRICLLARLNAGDHVLDVGTGTGIAARRAAHAVGPGGRVLGVDLSEGMVRVAKECAVPAGDARPEYRIMGAEALELPDGSFDAVISLCAVPHFPDVARALGEMRRVLRPGGRLVVSYGSVRPVSPLSLGRHVARRLLAGALHAVRPTLVGTGYLVRLTERMLPDTPETSGTEWGAGRRLAALVRTVAECGFEQLEVAWCGHEVLFDSAEEFWEAQAAIVTQVRKRLALSSTEAVEAVRQAFLKHASDVLQRGGKLVYPYGARFVAASAAR